MALLGVLVLQLVACASRAAVAAAAVEPTLVEPPIGPNAVYLDGDGWIATCVGGTSPAAATPLKATVPGDIISDLQRAGRVGDPYWNVTWRDPAFIAAWNSGTWEYTRKFASTAAMMRTPAETVLVFDGVQSWAPDFGESWKSGAGPRENMSS